MATLTIYDDTVSNTLNFGSGSTPVRAQGFKIAASSVIEAVGIKGSQGISASGTFKIQIYEGGATPRAGTLIIEETFTTTAVLPAYTFAPVMHTVTFTTPTGTLTGGSTQYYLILNPLTGSASDEVRWSADNTSPSYSDGTLWIGLTGGDELAAWDHNFAIYGTTGGGGGGATPSRLMIMGLGV